MNVEYLHVSQLYETITCFAIMVLFVTEGLALYNEMWGHISSFRQNAQAEENEWIRIESIQAAQREANDPEKSVGQALRQSASQGDPSLPEGKQDNKSNIDQFLNELTPSQKSFLIFYLEYSSFISEHTSIILSVLVLGILTQSTMVFSLACFFCYLFCSLMFDFLHLEERLKEEYKRGIVLRRLVKILSSCFILAIFIDYWASNEFTQ